MKNISISTDKSKLDISFIYNFLSKSYWANKRTKQDIEKSIANSRAYGIYIEDQQIGFARILSDQVVFAYLMDVFIDEKYRGNGYAKKLLEFILSDPELKDVKIWYLRTDDAHNLYKQFGFTELVNPKTSMEIYLK